MHTTVLCTLLWRSTSYRLPGVCVVCSYHNQTALFDGVTFVKGGMYNRLSVYPTEEECYRLPGCVTACVRAAFVPF